MTISLLLIVFATYLMYTAQNKFKCSNHSLNSNNTANQSIIAIAFYGMSRNLSITLPSIKHRVFNILDRHNILYDIFWHTLITDEIHQLRSKDDGKIDPDDFNLVNPCRYSLSDQDEIQMKEFNKYCLVRNITKEGIYSNNITNNFYDNWNDSYVSVRNILGAFYTLSSVYDIIYSYSMKNSFKYDAILVIRPDTAMIKDIDLPLHLNTIKDSTLHDRKMIWIPNFEHWNGYNDRSAYGNIAAMEIYMKRGIFYRDQYLLSSNGEYFLKYILLKYHIIVHMSNMRFLRVRTNNLIDRHDRKFQNMHVLKHDIDFMNCISEDRLHFNSSC